MKKYSMYKEYNCIGDVYAYSDTIGIYAEKMNELYNFGITHIVEIDNFPVPENCIFSFYDINIKEKLQIDNRDILAIELPEKTFYNYIITNNDLLCFECENFEVLANENSDK